MRGHLLGALIATTLFPAFAAGASPAQLATLGTPIANGGKHRHPARGRTGALRIQRASVKARNVARNRRNHRG